MAEILVPTTFRDRVEELVGTRRQVWLVAGLIVVVGLVALVLRSRATAPVIAPPAESGTVVPAVAASPTALSSAPTSTTILVHVAGAVRRPGLYEITAGARIADAIDLARGPTPNADLDALNLAEPIVDGQKIEVPRKGQSVDVSAPATVPPGSSASPLPGGVVNLNTADQAALETIPGIGPVTAQAIIAYRTEIGSFESIDQLLEVSGIGPATLESMRPYVTL